jgi:hypothetical protein
MILRSDLPIKYYLNLHGEEKVRDKYYFLFEILQYVIRVANMKDRQLTEENYKFSSKSLKYVFGDRIKDETFKTELVKSLKELIHTDYLKSEKDFMYINKKGLTYFYTLND